MKSIYDEEYRELVGQLVARRKALGMTQSNLAEIVGWDQSYISKVERFVRRIDLIETKRLCEALDLDLADLF